MSSVDRYRTIADLPRTLPVFPLARALLLPRAQLPLNIFEPRYLAMVDAALAGDRLIGMIQPTPGAADGDDDRPPLVTVGAAGRITAYSETPDGRYLVTLTGIARFRLVAEVGEPAPYRTCRVDYGPFADDLSPNLGEEAVDRDRLLGAFGDYLEANSLQVDWDEVRAATTEALVNALAILSPYGPEEKQAMLEAPDLCTRAEILIALTEIELGHGKDGAPLQ